MKNKRYPRVIKVIYRSPYIQLPIKYLKYFYESNILPILKPEEFKNLRNYNSVGIGKRIFIIATAPSLTLSDLELLKNETCMSCNSIIYFFEKTKWRPQYYTIVDHGVYHKLKEVILQYKDEIPVFFHPYTFHYKEKNSQSLKWKRVLCSNPKERKLILQKYRQVRFGTNLSKILYEDTSVMHACMQIAISMRFSEIYLLGCDCTFTGHAKGLEHNLKDSINSPYDYHKGAINDYIKAREVANKLDIRIYNATRGGQLDVFERVTLEDVVKKKKK